MNIKTIEIFNVARTTLRNQSCLSLKDALEMHNVNEDIAKQIK